MKILLISEYLLPAVLILILVVGVGGFFALRLRIRNFSRRAFGTDSIFDGFKKQADEEAATPRSLSAMTSVYLPRIAKDFPEFSWSEFRKLSENLLIGALRSVSEQKLLISQQDVGENLCEQIRAEIAHDQSMGEVRSFRAIRVHRTEISRYERHEGTCTITLQSAVEYYAFTKRGEELITGSETILQQAKYETELVYVQDAVQAGAGNNAVGVICPNCGAPVTNLGHKFCEYCGTAVTEINLRVWRLNGFRQIR